MARKRRTATAEPGTVIGYVRVSTGEQARSGLGLDAQRSAITEAVERRGWHLREIAEDAGRSAKTRNRRPGLQGALDAIGRGEADTLMVSKLDRLSRSLPDFADIMGEAKSGGWNLVALDLGVDTSTPAGSMVATVMAAVAQWERDIISERTVDGLAEKKKRGARLGPPVQLPDDLRHRIVAMHDAGTSLNAIARTLNDEGVPTAKGGRQWYPTTVAHVIRSVALDVEADATRSRRDDATT